MSLYTQFYRQYDLQEIHTIPEERFKSLASIFKDFKVEGDIAELGVAHGGTTKLLNHFFSNRTIYAFDTFEGFAALPNKYTDNESKRWKDWGTKKIQWQEVIKELKQLGNIVLRKGIFPDTTIGLENKTYSLVHIDTDIYLSTIYGLDYFYDRMVEGGIIIIDDLFRPHDKRFRQVSTAVTDFFNKRELNWRELVDFKGNIGHGVIIKG